jgi:hypothetical protein
MKDTLVRERRKLTFCIPLTLAKDMKLKNFTVRIPTDHDMDSVLLVEFIRDFRRPGSVSEKRKRGRTRTSTYDGSSTVCTSQNRSLVRNDRLGSLRLKLYFQRHVHTE